ncbi:hypothetical protein PGB90_007010 [Kerria lacca]
MLRIKKVEKNIFVTFFVSVVYIRAPETDNLKYFYRMVRIRNLFSLVREMKIKATGGKKKTRIFQTRNLCGFIFAKIFI